MSKETTFIYGLKDPRTDEIRYIGKSNHPDLRLQAHLKDKKSNRNKAKWIDDLQTHGLIPEIEILDEVDIDSWCEAEIEWIAKGFNEGWNLTNVSPGGTGATAGWAKVGLVDFVEGLYGSDYAKEFEKLDISKQGQILEGIALSSLWRMVLVVRAYKYFNKPIPVAYLNVKDAAWDLLDDQDNKKFERVRQVCKMIEKVTDAYIETTQDNKN